MLKLEYSRTAKSMPKIRMPMLMGWCKKDVTPLLTHWSYALLALTHRCNEQCWYPICTVKVSWSSVRKGCKWLRRFGVDKRLKMYLYISSHKFITVRADFIYTSYCYFKHYLYHHPYFCFYVHSYQMGVLVPGFTIWLGTGVSVIQLCEIKFLT